MIGAARHSKTDELLLVYRCRYESDSLRVRPVARSVKTPPVAGADAPSLSSRGDESQWKSRSYQPRTAPACTRC